LSVKLSIKTWHSRLYDFQGHPRSGSSWGDDLSPLSGLFFILSLTSQEMLNVLCHCYRYWDITLTSACIYYCVLTFEFYWQILILRLFPRILGDLFLYVIYWIWELSAAIYRLNIAFRNYYLLQNSHHHHVACPAMNIAIPTSVLHACRFCAWW